MIRVLKIYPKADFNDAWYPIMNQVRCAGVNPSRGERIKHMPVKGATKPHQKKGKVRLNPKDCIGNSPSQPGRPGVSIDLCAMSKD
jgi:hypothetical protein